MQLTVGFIHLTTTIKPKTLTKNKMPVKFTMVPFIWFATVLAVYWPIYFSLNTSATYYRVNIKGRTVFILWLSLPDILLDAC